MSYPPSNVPGVDNLAELSDVVTEFADDAGVTIVPVTPERDYGPQVIIEPKKLDLPGFLALAKQLGVGVLYLQADPLDPDGVGEDRDDRPAHLIQRRGQVGLVIVAFVVNGVVHFWEQRTAWFEEWEDFMDSTSARPPTQRGELMNDELLDERFDYETRDRLASELADIVLATPQFRAAKLGNARQRAGELALPKDTDESVRWRAIRIASERADDLARVQYDQLTERLDDLAGELLIDPVYQRAASAAARKQAAEQFLIPHADGFCPPGVVRDELYARAQQLSKTKRTAGLF